VDRSVGDAQRARLWRIFRRCATIPLGTCFPLDRGISGDPQPGFEVGRLNGLARPVSGCLSSRPAALAIPLVKACEQHAVEQHERRELKAELECEVRSLHRLLGKVADSGLTRRAGLSHKALRKRLACGLSDAIRVGIAAVL